MVKDFGYKVPLWGCNLVSYPKNNHVLYDIDFYWYDKNNKKNVINGVFVALRGYNLVEHNAICLN